MKKINFILEHNIHNQDSESVWAEHINDMLYQIKNVPYYIKGVSYDDIVEINLKSDLLWFKKVVMKSGHSTYRIIFFEKTVKFESTPYWCQLEKLGCTYERAYHNFYAIDVPETSDIYAVYNVLELGEKEGVWDFEEGDCGHLINNS